MKDEINKLVEYWKRDAEQYGKQVEEARKSGSTFETMLGMATALKQCAKELEKLNDRNSSK